MGLLPTKGLTLPFMSYGGELTLCYSFAIGVILAADRDKEFYKPVGRETLNIS